MAKFRSHIYAEIRGSTSGTVYSRNRFGAYTRNRVSPVQPRTDRQLEVRGIFAGLARLWSLLSEEDREGWRAYAENVSRIDTLGQSYRITGLQAFISHNATRDAMGIGVTTTPPPPDIVAPTLTAITLSVEPGSEKMLLEFSPSPLQNTALLITATRPLNPGVTFAGAGFKLVTVQNPAGAQNQLTSPASFWAQYASLFGAPKPGRRIFVRVTPVVRFAAAANPANGIRGGLYAASAVALT